MSAINAIPFGSQTIIYERMNEGWRAIVFGTGEPVGISPELLEAIIKDQAHQETKRNRA